MTTDYDFCFCITKESYPSYRQAHDDGTLLQVLTSQSYVDRDPDYSEHTFFTNISLEEITSADLLMSPHGETELMGYDHLIITFPDDEFLQVEVSEFGAGEYYEFINGPEVEVDDEAPF